MARKRLPGPFVQTCTAEIFDPACDSLLAKLHHIRDCRSNMKPSPAPPEATADPGAVSAKPMTNPTLSASLRADYEALQNDVQQARELANEFQRQLAGKSNEFAELKRLFEKTRNDLVRLEANITEIREERHRLANKAMEAIAFERRITERDAEIAKLKEEIDSLKHQLAKAGEGKAESESGSRFGRFKWLR